jgi:hypothetical protein
MLSSSNTVLFATFTLLATSATAAPTTGLEDRSAKPPAFFLAGDSTTAKQAANGGGKRQPHVNVSVRSRSSLTKHFDLSM